MKRPLVLLVLALVSPMIVSAQSANPPTSNVSANYQFARQGVFGCNLTGSYSMSVGAMSAVGGVYVPVNDAAVTLNTGYLVYKECVLRGIVNREGESAGSGLIKQAITNTLTGRGGNSYFVSDFTQEQKQLQDTNAVYSLQNHMGDLPQSLKGPVTQALARSYMAQTAGKRPTCSYRGDYRALATGKSQDSDFFTALRASLDPNCVPLQLALSRQGDLDAYLASKEYQWEKNLDWGNGFYPVETVDAKNNHIVLTPGILNSAVIEQAVTSGFRKIENANDIDQMVGALFAGLGNQAISSAKGLVGLTEKIGTQPSYLNQIAAESAAGLRNSAANAAIQILTAALTVEKSYNGTVGAIATTLTSTITQLRATENQCWSLIISKVCSTALQPDNTCQYQPPCTQTTQSPGGGPFGTINQAQQSCPPAIPLKVATTTIASQQVIDSQITPLANQTVSNIGTSNNAIKLINQIITGVTNTTSVDAQRLALVQLDQLVAQGALHNQTQLTTIQQQQAAIKDAMTSLYNDTKTAWGDSTDPNVGWCNVNNPSVIQMWIQRWTR